MNHFTPFRIPHRRRSILSRVIVAFCVVAWSASLWFAVNNIASAWHAASTIGRPAFSGGN